MLTGIRPAALPLAASLGAQAVMSMIALTPPVLAVVAAPAFGLRASDVGLFTALLFLAAMFSATAGGALVERLGAIRVSQLSLLASSAGIALTATAEPGLAAVGALLVGLGYGPLTPASSHLLAPLTTGRNRPFVFSLKQTSVPLGGALAGLLAPLLAAGAGWRAAMLLVAATGVLAALSGQFLRARYDTDRDPAAPLRIEIVGPVREALAAPRLREICFVSLGYSIVQMCFSAFFVTFLVERAGLPLIQAGLALMIAQVAGVAGRVFWGTIAGRLISSRRLLSFLGVVMAASAVAAAFAGEGWPDVALLVLGAIMGLTAIGWNGLYLAEIVRVTSDRGSARATGAALFFTFGGMMAGPALFTALVAGTGSYRPAFLMLALAALVAASLMMRRPRPPGPDDDQDR